VFSDASYGFQHLRQRYGGSVTVINGLGDPEGVAVSPDGNTVYVTNPFGRISRLPGTKRGTRAGRRGPRDLSRARIDNKSA
jgi:sugar lactone lactonase YvrE